MNAMIRLARLADPHWKPIALGIGLAALTVGSNVGLMAISAFLLSWSALGPPVLTLMPAIAAVRFFGLARAVCRYLERYVNHRTTLTLLGRIRIWFYTKIEEKNPGQLVSAESSRFFSRLISDVDTLKDFYLRVLFPPLTALTVMLGGTVLLFFLSPPLALTFFIVYLLTGLGVPWLMHRLARKEQPLAEARSALEAQLTDSLHGMSDLLSFGREHEQLETVREKSLALTRLKEQSAARESLAGILTNFLSHLAMVAVMIPAIPLVREGRLDSLWFAPLALGVLSSFEAVAPLAQVLPNWHHLKAAGETILGLDSAAPHAEASLARPELKVENYALNVKQLCFTYPETKQPALTNLSFSLPAAQSLAIVGVSGAGKSTLVHLLLRFWDYSQGSVTLGGRELSTFSREELWSLTGVVSRQTHLFGASIRENLLLAKPQATEEELWIALDKAQLLSFVQTLPQGLDTPVGEGGGSLSGGQRQLLAIARAFLKNSPLLILDEATEGLDRLTEKDVLSAIRNLMQGRTTLMITHRLTGVREMDQLLVLDQGQVTHYGSPSRLLEDPVLYQRLVDLEQRSLLTV